ncbi:M4 family metallopeptidase [Candidatus Venteria ishoeyi]|uniref:Thermolysin n=1 Tax=Candidatus Venteria ishoeyi TaxID=1899563 RepID=A0A1H6F9P7_9GAMM|nr:M4 family metallopeptidase [Candidatus Venteria ishoeyi]SEH05744.1 Thermolysin precursor [Candidatus Venteria ishoeyi]
MTSNRTLFISLTILSIMFIGWGMLGIPFLYGKKQVDQQEPICINGILTQQHICVTNYGKSEQTPYDKIAVRKLPSIPPGSNSGKDMFPLSKNSEVANVAGKINNILKQLKKQPSTNNEKLSPARKHTISQLQKRLGDKLSVRKNPETGSSSEIKGGILEPAAKGKFKSSKYRNKVTAERFLRKNNTLITINNPKKELQLIKQTTDSIGRTRIRYTQQYRGIPVWPAELNVHLDKQGNVDMMNGTYMPSPNKTISLQPALTVEQATQKAMDELNNPTDAETTNPELIFFASGNAAIRLAWKLRVSPDVFERWLMVVDAINGNILAHYNEIMFSHVRGSGRDLDNRLKDLELWEANGIYYMIDTSKDMYIPTSKLPNLNNTKGVIAVYDLHNQRRSPKLAQSISKNSDFLPDAVSAAFGISEAYDYFRERHKRLGIDGKKGTIKGIVRAHSNMKNAFWDGKAMYFGDGWPFAGALDVVGHELMHGVTENTAGLVYWKQAGALNEAFSDIFGEMIEARTNGRLDWMVGTSLPAPLRNMKNPPSKVIGKLGQPYPNKMSNFVYTHEDHGGVHLNSSIINHAFYLLAEGLHDAVGLRDAEQIFFRALTVHLTSNSQFRDARLAAITSAEELFGSMSKQALKTAEAFDEVEIFGPSTTPMPSPSPSPLPSSSRAGDILFLCPGKNAGKLAVCRRNTGMGDGLSGVVLSKTPAARKRISISSDGAIAAFISTTHDICFINPSTSSNDICLNLKNQVNSVAISPDGKRYAYVPRDPLGHPSNIIIVIDLHTGKGRVHTPNPPVLSNFLSSRITQIDAIEFTEDGQWLIYDAMNELDIVSNHLRIYSWNINALHVDSGIDNILIEPFPLLWDFGNPSLSKKHDNLLVFEAISKLTGNSNIVAINFTNGGLSVYDSNPGTFGMPNYIKDNSAIISTKADVTASSGFSLYYQKLIGNSMTPSGIPILWLHDASFGVSY